MGDTAQEEVSHGDVDHGPGDVETLLEVADEPAPADQPSESPLDDSSAWQHFEPWFAVDAAHDLDNEVEERRLVEQPGTVVGAVGEQMLHPRSAFADRLQDRLRAGAIGDVRRGQVHHQQTAVRVDRDVALAADDLLVGIVAAAARRRRLDRLAVDDGGRWACLALSPLTVHHQSDIVDRAEQQQPHEASEPPVDRNPSAASASRLHCAPCSGSR